MSANKKVPGAAAIARVLKERGISVACTESLQLEYLAPEQVAQAMNLPTNSGFGKTTTPLPPAAIRIPNLDPATGVQRGFRLKLLSEYKPAGKKKKLRYWQPPGSDNLLFFPGNLTGARWTDVLADPTIPIFITEGEFKSAALAARGIPCIALTGVNSFRTYENEDDEYSIPIGDLNRIAWLKRGNYIIFDADALTNPNVNRAQRALAKELFQRGATPLVVKLPHIKGQSKTGVDDWWKARGKRADKEFAALLVSATSPFVLKTQSATDIVATKYKDPAYIVTGFLPVGLAMLNGPPKVRKSFLALAVAHAVAVGSVALGHFPTRQGAVLYCALEDTPRRIQSRLHMMGLAATPNLHFAFAHDLQRGSDGCEMLVRWCEQHPDARLIVVDTLQKFRGPSDGRINVYEADYAALSVIKDVADRFGIAILLVHHLRKGHADDVYERVSGSTAITGTPDTNMVLLRERTSDDGTLHITGRDIEEQEWALRFAATGLWTWVGDAERVRYTQAQQEIIDAIRAHGTPMTPTEIAQATGRTRGTLPKTLSRMLQEHKLDWQPGGKYAMREEDKARADKF